MTISTLPVNSTEMLAPVKQFLQRILPSGHRSFDVQLDNSLARDEFEISGGGDERVTVRAGSVSALTAGLNWYLKHYCHVHFSWLGQQLKMPEVLPRLAKPLRIESPYKWRYYFNFCTFSYSMTWWDWDRWEQEIDWMALNGINLPLSVTGQEIVWQKVYRQLGLTDTELGEFFAGPGFLAWGWMGNLDGWGGPTPQSWIDGQYRLQKRILKRQRELGIHPVLGSFTGHVPPALTVRFPDAKVKQLELWAEMFTGTYILDPADPLFQRIANLFMEAQRELYGTDPGDEGNFYSCDSFNENSPPDNSPAYLDAVGRQLNNGITATDPDAVWVLQDWMFHFNPTNPGFWQEEQIKAFLDAVPNERMLVLDLHSESFPLWKRTKALHGKPWIWCFLHSFGGHQSMFGNLQSLAHDPPATLANPDRGNLVGFGLTAEGIEQNPVMYDLATEQMWRKEEPDLNQWLRGYIHRRYGAVTEPAAQAWEIIKNTIYSRPTEWGGTGGTLVNLPPRWNADRGMLNYPNSELIPAWDCLVEASADLGTGDAFRHDLVDVARQVLTNAATAFQGRAFAAWTDKDSAGLREAGGRFVELLHDIDRLLATRESFLLGKWISSAKAWGTNDAERKLFEHNARLQITVWGHTHGMLRDYARKEWSGIIADFYAVRWGRFFQEQADSLDKGETFDEGAFQKRLRVWEEQWTWQTNEFSDQPTGDSVAVAAMLLKKYKPILQSLYRATPSLVTGKTVTCSAPAKPGNPPEYAITGVADRGSFWGAGEGSQWLMVDLDKPTEINAVHLFPYWDNRRYYQYNVEASLDAATWTTVVDASANTAIAKPAGDVHRFPAQSARYVRVTMLHNSVNEAKHLVDFRVYGPSHPLQ